MKSRSPLNSLRSHLRLLEEAGCNHETNRSSEQTAEDEFEEALLREVRAFGAEMAEALGTR